MKSELKVRSLISTWLNLIFFIILLLYVGYIEFFLNTQNDLTEKGILVNPIRPDILTSVSSISFKNRIGSYLVAKEKDQWFLKSPKTLPANTQTIKKIIAELSGLTIQTIHQKEPINIESFSLDNPTVEIKLFTDINETLSIKFGLINPIDNTTYMSLSTSDRIFQINLFKDSFQNYELSNFIDANIFSTPLEQIKKFYIYQGKQAAPFNLIQKKQTKWISQKYRSISQQRTNEKLETILEIKPHIIIDKKDDEISTFIQNYLDHPLYRILIIDSQGRKIRYTITNKIKKMPGLKVEKRTYFIMTASDRPYPYIVNKDFLRRFPIRYKDIRN